MTLLEAREILKKNGYKVIKESKLTGDVKTYEASIEFKVEARDRAEATEICNSAIRTFIKAKDEIDLPCEVTELVKYF